MAAKGRCQSCGMPLKSDPAGGARNADGSRNVVYCSYCFRDGQFLQPELTVEGMRALIIEKMKEKGFPGFLARFFTIGLEQLQRWR